MPSSAPTSQAASLRDLVRRTEVAGAQRRAVLLHTDLLPPSLAKAHHVRLARSALDSLAQADRAQQFELSRGRLAIVWRNRDGPELALAMGAIDHLLADLPAEQAVAPGQLVSLFDLPEQAPWLLDELIERPAALPDGTLEPTRVPDAAMMARLEQALMQADISRFMRWRPVLHVTGPSPTPAWEERYVAARDVAASLCPGYRIKADPWLFHRLTRSFDRRMLALNSFSQAWAPTGPFALHLNVASILSPEFLRFDAALPGTLRGGVTLNLLAADILADPASFTFARNFARTRGYRLLLRAACPALLAVLDLAAAELDYVQVAITPTLKAEPDRLRELLPRATMAVLTGLDPDSGPNWARTNGFSLVRGR
ncbi:MAG: hypothetical protein WDN04_01970, partial [Rhodospirillales bacterium]